MSTQDESTTTAVAAPAAAVEVAIEKPEPAAEAEAATTTTTTNENQDESSAVAEDEKPTKAVEESKGPSRRSTRISAATKPVVKDESAAGAGVGGRTRRSSTRKRGVEDVDEAEAEVGGASAKASKKAKSEIGLSIGDTLPSVVVKNEKDEEVDVSKLADEKGVVLFLIPKADTPGCTTQACGFRDNYEGFAGEGYDVYCVSADSSAAQKKWQDKKSLPYALLSDPSRTLISALGATDKGKTKRSHFVFAKGGKLVDKKVPVKPAESPKLALEFIKSFSGSGSGGDEEDAEGAGAKDVVDGKEVNGENGTAEKEDGGNANGDVDVDVDVVVNGKTEADAGVEAEAEAEATKENGDSGDGEVVAMEVDADAGAEAEAEAEAETEAAS